LLNKSVCSINLFVVVVSVRRVFFLSVHHQWQCSSSGQFKRHIHCSAVQAGSSSVMFIISVLVKTLMPILTGNVHQSLILCQVMVGPVEAVYLDKEAFHKTFKENNILKHVPSTNAFHVGGTWNRLNDSSIASHGLAHPESSMFLSTSVLWNAGMDNFLIMVDLMGESLGMT
jgi:hypothetical protein